MVKRQAVLGVYIVFLYCLTQIPSVGEKIVQRFNPPKILGYTMQCPSPRNLSFHIPQPNKKENSLIPKAQAQAPTQQVGFCLHVPVLMYHHVQPQTLAQSKGQTALSVDSVTFDAHMAYLVQSGYTTITAKQLIDALKNKTQLPGKSVVVTLDDGYKDAYEYAFPVFQKYNIIANLMISTGLVGGNDYLTWDQIIEMSKSGRVYLTDHTWSHYAVGKGQEEKIQTEIITAKQQLQEYTGQTVDVFTYPYGSYGPVAIDILEKNGFLGGYSTDAGEIQCDSFVMTLHRTRVGNGSLSSYGL